MTEYWMAWAVIGIVVAWLLLRGEYTSARIRKIRGLCPTCGLPYDARPDRPWLVCRCTSPTGGAR